MQFSIGLRHHIFVKKSLVDSDKYNTDQCITPAANSNIYFSFGVPKLQAITLEFMLNFP